MRSGASFTAETMALQRAFESRRPAASNLTIHTAAGYDDVNGVGTPNGAAFLDALSS